MAVAIPAIALVFPSLLVGLNLTENQTIFAGEDGIPYLIDIDDTPLQFEETEIVKTALDDITFILYTRANRNGESLDPLDTESLMNSNWDPKKATRMITHGWRGTGGDDSCTLVRDAYLDVDDYNVIIIDWRTIAKSFIYSNVAKSVPLVGRYVADFIDFLEIEGGLDHSTTKLVGHSLGAHVVSIASFTARRVVAEIVALDPARPYFQTADSEHRVDASHAHHVQIIHTNAGRLGLPESFGTSDFYPNGGTYQPGCPSYDIFGTCAHRRSYLYFAESIRNPQGFPGIRENEYADKMYLSGLNQAYMGGPSLDQNAEGIYNLDTRSEPPFALG